MRSYAEYVRCVRSSVHFIPHMFQTIHDNSCCLSVIVQIVRYTFLPFRCKSGFCCTLGYVCCAVILGALPPHPHRLQSCLVRYYGIAAAHCRETGTLAETVHFYCHLLGAFYLIDTMRNARFRDKGFVGGIENNNTLVFTGIFHPQAQLVMREHNTCWVVGKAEVNDVHRLLGQFRNKSIFFYTWYKNYLPACHDIRIHIGRIGRVKNRHCVLFVK